MDPATKKIWINVAIVVLVPSVATGLYFGTKYAIKKWKAHKEKKKVEKEETKTDTESEK